MFQACCYLDVIRCWLHRKNVTGFNHKYLEKTSDDEAHSEEFTLAVALGFDAECDKSQQTFCEGTLPIGYSKFYYCSVAMVYQPAN